MDGGTQSWAESEDTVYKNLNASLKKVMAYDPDFLLLQEVDENSTRTYHINELEFINLVISKPYYFTYAYNYYRSPFIIYPFLEPHGTITSGIVTYSGYRIESAERRSLPISESISKVIDLDRCYSVSRVPLDNGKYIVLFNVHLSAYGSDDSVREGQTSMLFGEMQAEYEAGNYVVCGGDFNHDLLSPEGSEGYSTWACPFPRSVIPEHFALAMDLFGEDFKQNLAMTCRDCDEPYTKGHTNEFIVDGFIVSDNIKVITYENLNTGYINSDHEPVLMTFELN
ncbi:MAG: endonuclease/exonuclease/phosphatase family protein [Lachnospiraceae bacterium]|nr:endonuclease/exonuclease/phosphatase family protein [Lachnospiraceae bacterium]